MESDADDDVIDEGTTAAVRRCVGAAAGLVAAVLALGVAELVAGLRREWRTPVVDVGDRVIDNVPPFVKDFAIETFGTNDTSGVRTSRPRTPRCTSSTPC